MPGTLTRSASGLLFRDTFTRADGALGANWQAMVGNIANAVIVGNRLRMTQTGGPSQTIVRPTDAAFPRVADQHIQVSIARDTLTMYASVNARYFDANRWIQFDNRVGGAVPQLIRQSFGETVLANGSYVGQAVNVADRHTVSVKGTRFRAWINGLAQADVVDASGLVAGASGAGLNVVFGGFAYFTDFIVCSASTLTVSGLPAGYKIRVGALVSAAAVAGTPLVLDLLGASLPVALVEIIDGSNVVQSSFATAFGGDTFAYAADATLSLTATLPMRFTLTGALASDRVLRAALSLRLALAGRMETSRVMQAALALRFALAGRIGTSRVMSAALSLRFALAARLTQRPEWIETDFGPDIIDSGFERVTIVVGIGPEFGATRDIQYTNRAGVFGGITMTWDHYQINSWTTDPFWHTDGHETFQFLGGTGVNSTLGGYVTLDKPIRGLTVTTAQIDFNDNKVLAFDANDNLVGTLTFTGAQGMAGYPVTNTLDVGANVIRKLRFLPDPADWVCWYDLSIFYDQPSGHVGGWSASDAAPDSAWVASDAPPATAWN